MRKKRLRVLVCGSHLSLDPDTEQRVCAALDELKPDLVIHGLATGVDAFAGKWAERKGVPCMAFQPAWTRYGFAAGPKRNAWMLEWGEPDLVLAFPGGGGTENMIKLAEEADVEVRRVS